MPENPTRPLELATKKLRTLEILPGHRPAIEAAIRFGQWLKGLEVTTAEQKAAITEVQDALRKLPEVTERFVGGYSFHATEVALSQWDGSGSSPTGVARSWFVDYEDARSTGGVLLVEIGNVFSPYPESERDILAGFDREYGIYLCDDEQAQSCHFIDENWVKQVDSLGQYIAPAYAHEVEANSEKRTVAD